MTGKMRVWPAVILSPDAGRAFGQQSREKLAKIETNKHPTKSTKLTAQFPKEKK